MEPLSPGITVPAAICPRLQVGKDQSKAVWKVSDFLGHYRALPGRDTLPISQDALSAACRCDRGDNPVALVAQGQCQPHQSCAHPASTSSQPARDSGPPAGTVTSAFPGILNVTLQGWLLLTQPGREETILHRQNYNLNLRNPRRTCPCITTCQLSKKDTLKATIAH